MFLRSSSTWCYVLFSTIILLLAPTTVTAQCITFYDAKPVALEAATSDERVHVEEQGSFWSFLPTEKVPTIPVGFIFYQGAYVDPLSYAPIARALAEHGYPSFLLKIPLDFAFLGPFKASKVIDKYDHKMETWVIGGHSLGGVVASMYVQLNQDDVAGLVLLASYPTPVVCNLSRLDIQVTSLWGTLDGVTSREQWEGGRNQLPDDALFLEIEGGNHAQMGYYGPQEGDNPASITTEQQQAIVVTETLALMESVAIEYGFLEDNKDTVPPAPTEHNRARRNLVAVAT